MGLGLEPVKPASSCPASKGDKIFDILPCQATQDPSIHPCERNVVSPDNPEPLNDND